MPARAMPPLPADVLCTASGNMPTPTAPSGYPYSHPMPCVPVTLWVALCDTAVAGLVAVGDAKLLDFLVCDLSDRLPNQIRSVEKALTGAYSPRQGTEYMCSLGVEIDD